MRSTPLYELHKETEKANSTNSSCLKNSTAQVHSLFIDFMAFIALAAFIIFIYRVVVVNGVVMAARNMELQVIEVKLVAIDEWIYAITTDIYRIRIEN